MSHVAASVKRVRCHLYHLVFLKNFAFKATRWTRRSLRQRSGETSFFNRERRQSFPRRVLLSLAFEDIATFELPTRRSAH